MKVLIRCDVGGQHGLGHATRCHALAHELTMRGAEVAFLTTTPWLSNVVTPYLCLAVKDHDSTDSFDVLIVDSVLDYQQNTPACWLRERRKMIVRIDDPHATPETCSLLVMPNMHTPAATLARLHTVFGYHLLVGVDYVMLHHEVTVLPPLPYSERIHGPVVFCTGGSDTDEVLKKMWEWLAPLPRSKRVREFMYSQASSDFFLHTLGMTRGDALFREGYQLVPFRRRTLRDASLIVTTMGQTVYEALWWQTPVLIVGHTDRHCAAARLLVRFSSRTVGFCDIRTLFAESFLRLVTLWITNESDYTSPILIDGRGMDGRGVERVATRILEIAS